MPISDRDLDRWESGQPIAATRQPLRRVPPPAPRPASKPQDAWLHIGDVAKILGVHRNTAYRWASAGEFVSYRFGGTIRVRKSDLEKFIEGARIDGVTE